MEEKLPNDKLEDFLKKSFEGYTESPSGDLWDKIEAGMGAAPAPKPLISRVWWIVAAAAVVLGIFVGQHFYFQNKLENLTRELEKNTVELQQLESKNQDGENTQTLLPETEPTPDQGSAPQAEATPDATPVPPVFDQKTPAATALPGSDDRIISKKQQQKTSELAFYHENNEVVEPREPKTNAPSISQMETVVSEIPNPVSNPVSTGRPATPSLLEVLMSGVEPQHAKAPKPNFYQPLIDPVRSETVSVGVRAMPMTARERISKVRPDIFHHRPGGPDKFFNNQQEVTGQAFTAGASLEYKPGGSLSLVSGIDYRRTEIASSHRSEFKFKERRMPGGHHGGQDNHRHDFDYNLNTSSGLVELEVRVEATDTTRSIPDNEVLAFQVNTNKVTTHLSIPLALKYSIGKGRLHGYLKGGVAVNFLLNESFSISQIRSLNNHFRVSPVRPMKGDPQNLKTVSLSYLAAAGLEYDLTRSLSLSLEPTFMGSLSSQHSANFIRSSSYLAGVSAGLSYSF
jgi:opacity protein-like surface antigen